MKKSVKLFVIAMLLLSGCSWIRIAEKPSYNTAEPIPITVGIQLQDNSATNTYGPMVVKFLNEFNVFKSTVYPYKTGDNVDGVLTMNINGGWTGHGALSGIFIGLTLGLVSPFIGPSITGYHDTESSLLRQSAKIVSYQFQTESKVRFGLMANSSKVGAKADDLQSYKIAYEIANRLKNDKEKIRKAFMK